MLRRLSSRSTLTFAWTFSRSSATMSRPRVRWRTVDVKLWCAGIYACTCNIKTMTCEDALAWCSQHYNLHPAFDAFAEHVATGREVCQFALHKCWTNDRITIIGKVLIPTKVWRLKECLQKLARRKQQEGDQHLPRTCVFLQNWYTWYTAKSSLENNNMLLNWSWEELEKTTGHEGWNNYSSTECVNNRAQFLECILLSKLTTTKSVDQIVDRPKDP